MKRSLCTLIWIVAATITCSAQNTSYFPQIADGQAGSTVWTTGIAITNPAAPGTSAATGTITFTKDDGTPFNIAFKTLPNGPAAGSGNAIPFQLAGGQTSYFNSTGAAALTVGFGTVTSSLPVIATAVFQESAGSANGDTIAQAGVAAVAPLTRQAIFAIEERYASTGVAIANPGTATANITFQLVDTNGVVMGSAINTTLAAKNHTAKFVSELFPSVAGSFLGTMQITSQIPLASTALLFQGNGTFGTLPVIPLASLFNPAIEWLEQRLWRNPLESLARLAGLQFKLC